MGNTYTVTAWVEPEYPLGDYRDLTMWSGESLIAALWNFFLVKREGYGCVKLEWR